MPSVAHGLDAPDPVRTTVGTRLMAGAVLGLAALGIVGCSASAAPLPPTASISSVYQDPDGDWITLSAGPHGKGSEMSARVGGDVFVRHVDPGAIGKIADACKQDAVHGVPPPCALVHLNDGPEGDRGYVVLKGLDFPHEFLTISTAPLTGIEDPRLTAPGAENYFADAWRDGRAMTARAEGRSADSLPRDAIGLAINSMDARTQNRLHVHSDRLDPDLARPLKRQLDRGRIVARQWKPLAFQVHGHRYQATWVDGAELAQNPFRLVHDRLAREHGGGAAGEDYARARMGEQSIAVVGETTRDGRPGFIILNGHVDPDHAGPDANGDSRFAEEWLQGHAHAAP